MRTGRILLDATAAQSAAITRMVTEGLAGASATEPERVLGHWIGEQAWMQFDNMLAGAEPNP